ncbi:PIN domain-containing protein [Flavivirga abyssicola]|uniref:PIN domain-containing protein n=1 Tax=Flavivirga abyssicola TaxID=3063533 RepID=UPI0026DFAB09|nr:PIN domain-containing protein [Flavivirga sp. MEBiC07777]WVK14877.1 PIN domain-containing protein [Flavivirga sp. MEBiC07777]
MRILIDTNIIIHREANRVINEDIGLLFNWLDRLKFDKCVHPLSIEEISCHQDENVVKTMKIKIANYNLLKTESADDQLITQIRQTDNSRNDFIDTNIVKEVYNNRVDYLITEDRGIHRKANFLNCSEKVFKIDTFLEKCIAENPELKNYQVLAVKKEYFGNININDVFFDSFKQDYNEFEDWFNRKADNISYVCVTDGDVKAFLYLKQEDINEIYNDIEPSFPQKKRLKIGTFKVISTGYKLGERFLKVIFDNALQYDVEEIYVTIFDKRDEQLRLIYLLEDWGFKHWGAKTTENGIEQVFVRECKPTPNLQQPKLSFPAVSKNTLKWIVPIYPEYHTELFPDSILNNESPQDFTENEPYRNAIKKVYISRSYNRNLNSGDLVLFYRTGGHYAGVVSTIGVVENIVTNIQDENHFIELCRKRSVFDNTELKKYWNWNKNNRPFIVNFLYIDSFPMPKVNLKKLRDLNIIQNAPRGFESISDAKFEQILKEARANESYIID